MYMLSIRLQYDREVGPSAHLIYAPVGIVISSSICAHQVCQLIPAQPLSNPECLHLHASLCSCTPFLKHSWLPKYASYYLVMS